MAKATKKSVEPTAKPSAGRKKNHYIDSNGKQHLGLAKVANTNRWRMIETNKFFTAHSETEAFEKFAKLSGKKPLWTSKETILDLYSDDSEEKIVEHFEWPPPPFNNHAKLWAWVADQIRENPKHVAKETGIEEIGYLTTFEKPEALPSFAYLRKLYAENSTAQKGEIAKVLRSWDLFATKVSSVQEITPKSAIAFADYFSSLGQSNKSAFHCFNGIKRVFTFAISKAVAMDELKKRLEYLKLMKPKGSPNANSNPNPLTKKEFQTILKHATDAQDRAMILLCLNGAYTLGEVITLKWEDIIDGCIVSHRKKKGNVIRACVLWEETKKAIKAIPNKKAKHLFTSYLGTGISASTAQVRFNAVADKAKLPTITGSQFRDSAQTSATQANISERLVDIMAGHKAIGITDKYIARNPMIVKPATDAVYDFYFGK